MSSPGELNRASGEGALTSSGSPLRRPFGEKGVMLERSSVGGDSTLKMRLVATEDYLDVNRLIGEIKSQHKDSYSLHCLLQKVKDHTDSLQ